MKPNSILNFGDLEREEIRIRMRLNKQEEAIKSKLKTLPEEIVIAGISKLITGVLSGNLFSSIFSIIRTVGSVFSGNKDSKTSSHEGIFNLIKSIVKAKFSS